MERAVPAMIFAAISTSFVFRSGIFASAISSTCFLVSVATLVLFGSPLPFLIFALAIIATGIVIKAGKEIFQILDSRNLMG